MARALLCALLLAASVSVLGCGDDEDSEPPSRGTDRGPFISLSEAESVIGRGGLAVVRTGGGDDAAPGVDPSSLVDSARYESQSGREFDVLVFVSEAAALRAAPKVIAGGQGESGIRAANVVTVFPTRASRAGAYRAVERAMRRLRRACQPGARGDPSLRRLCFEADAGIPPPGEGVNRDEAQDEEEPIVVDGLRYDPLVARQLNPRIAPDEGILSGRTPPAGKVWFGVFLRVCNDGEKARTSSSRLALIDAFGTRLQPSGALPAGNPFTYDSRSIEPGECLPQPDSVPERVDGALVLFAVTPEFLTERPIALGVEGERVILDI